MRDLYQNDQGYGCLNSELVRTYIKEKGKGKVKINSDQLALHAEDPIMHLQKEKEHIYRPHLSCKRNLLIFSQDNFLSCIISGAPNRITPEEKEREVQH